MITRQDALNDALDRLAGYEYLDMPGPFACHGPMGAETLSTLGHDDLVGAWVEGYKTRHQPLDAFPGIDRIDPVSEGSWQPALGDISRASDWAEMFARELEDHPWQEVLQGWLPRLMPGCGGALTHGIIRVAHGVRAMPADGRPSKLLVGELAKGLALWAAAFTNLPGRPDLGGLLALDEAVARLPRPEEPWSQIEAGTFARIGELQGFPDAIEALGPPDAVEDALSDLTEASCRVLLAYPEVFPVPLVHTVTPTGAVRILLPYLPEYSIESLYAQLWHVNAAIICGFTPRTPLDAMSSRDLDDAWAPEEIAARATEHQDPHVLKFSEACLREHAVRPDPLYMLAAQSVLERTPRW